MQGIHFLYSRKNPSFRCPFVSVRSPGYSRDQPCFSSTVPGALEPSAGAALSALTLPYVTGHTAARSVRAFPEDLFLCSGIKQNCAWPICMHTIQRMNADDSLTMSRWRFRTRHWGRLGGGCLSTSFFLNPLTKGTWNVNVRGTSFQIHTAVNRLKPQASS